ncbi:MAG TPA: beta-phosphoglucomutase family hydrolase [Bryobacteraceae bacterium]|nr:beta-phosphoglucomutase family hydrolase [Bryobacteraceae bacterium]
MSAAGPAEPRLAQGLALVFDMDGVLIDSNPLHVQAWEIFNRRYGLETTEAMRQDMYGRRNDEIVRAYYGDRLTPEEVVARGAAKEELYRQLAGDRIEEILMPGLRAFLECHRHDPMAVASNAEPANVAFILERAGLRDFFRVVVDGHQVHHPKPHPDIYLRTAELLRIAAANCLVFEDSYAGIEAARAAGARVIGVLTTHGDLPGAELTIDNFGSGKLEPWLRSQKPVL